MPYEKQTWATGDTITAEKLNHMEDGIAGGTLVIGGVLVIGGFTYDGERGALIGTSDKTWQEINDALAAGARCVIVYTKMGKHCQLIVTITGLEDDKYLISDDDDNFVAKATSADGYPATGTAPVV